MEKVSIGTKVSRLGIPRLSVGEGFTCRAILIDQDPRMKHIAYDNARKCRVEVDQDMCIRFKLRPAPTFFYLVAKLNTDLNGNVIGDKFTVEYLQLSENLNNEFSDNILEQGIPKSLQLTKVKKSGEGGKDYSYVKVVPSQRGFEDNVSLWEKINQLRNNEDFINAAWAMIDADTSLNKQQYIELVSQGGDSQQAQGTRQLENRQANQRQLESKATAQHPHRESVMPQAPSTFAQDNDFGHANDFGGDDDFGE